MAPRNEDRMKPFSQMNEEDIQRIATGLDVFVNSNLFHTTVYIRSLNKIQVKPFRTTTILYRILQKVSTHVLSHFCSFFRLRRIVYFDESSCVLYIRTHYHAVTFFEINTISARFTVFIFLRTFALSEVLLRASIKKEKRKKEKKEHFRNTALSLIHI